jgi:hypothetical protein
MKKNGAIAEQPSLGQATLEHMYSYVRIDSTYVSV